MPRPVLPLPSFLTSERPIHSGRVDVRIAFRDCDPMGVLWHGNYLAYCELGRNTLGEAVGFGLTRIGALGLFAPVVRSQVLHHVPLRPDQAIVVETALYPTAQPRLYHRYRLLAGDQVMAEAETEQVLTDRSFVLALQQPAELAAIMGRGTTG